MPRPNKILVPTKNYNLSLPQTDWDILSKHAHIQSERYRMQVSVADLIRSSISLYIEDLDQAEREHNEKVTSETLSA